MKRSMKMAVLLVVLAAFAGGYVAVTRLPASSTTVTEEEGQFALYEGDADSLAALEWTKEGLCLTDTGALPLQPRCGILYPNQTTMCKRSVTN